MLGPGAAGSAVSEWLQDWLISFLACGTQRAQLLAYELAAGATGWRDEHPCMREHMWRAA